MRDLVIVGAGGVGRGAHQIVEDINSQVKKFNFLGFIDDALEKAGQEIHGYPILGTLEWLESNPEVNVVIALSDPMQRKTAYERLLSFGVKRFPSLIHPLAWAGNRVEIGMGCIIYAGVRINTDSCLKDFVIINMNSTVGHDVQLESFVTIAPGVNISGTVIVEENCELGTNSAILQGLKIEKETVVGAGSVVTSSLPPGVTAVGIPARKLKKRKV